MKANLVIIILLVVVVGAGAVIIWYSLTPRPEANGGPGPLDIVADGDGAGKPAGGDGTSTDGGTTGQGGETTQPPDGATEPGGNGNNVEPAEKSKLDVLLDAFSASQKRIQWMRADLMMAKAGIFTDESATDEDLKKTGSKGTFKFKPGIRCAFEISSKSGEVVETTIFRAYVQTMWLITKSGDTVKAERWFIDNEKMYEALLLLQGADASEMKRTFDITLVDLWNAEEQERLEGQGYEVEKLKENEDSLVELVYKDEQKRAEYKLIQAVMGKLPRPAGEPEQLCVKKIKMYSGFNEEKQLIWFDNAQINEGEPVPDGDFRVSPEKEGIEKFDDHVMLAEPADIVARMRLTTRQVKGITAGFEQDRYDAAFAGAAGGGHKKKAGTFCFKPDNKFLIDLTEPKKEIIVSNGKKLYDYVPDLEQATMYDVQQAARQIGGGDRAALSKFFGQDAEYLAGDYDFKLLGVEKLNGWEAYHFDLTLKNKAARATDAVYNTERIELWVEVETLLAARIIMYDLQIPANYYEVTMKDISIYEDFPDSKFEPETVIPESIHITEGGP